MFSLYMVEHAPAFQEAGITAHRNFWIPNANIVKSNFEGDHGGEG